MKRLAPWLAATAVLLLIAGAAVAGYYLFPLDAADPARVAADGGDTVTPPPAPPPLKPDHDYVVLVRTVEVHPTGPGGKTWERGFEDGPDLAYDLSWRGVIVFKSETKDDTLVGKWDAVKVDVWNAATSGEVGLGETLNAGAVIHTPAGDAEESLRIRVWDSDLFDDDEAGEVELNLSDLHEGKNVFTYDATPENAIARLVVGVTDADQPAASLLEALSGE